MPTDGTISKTPPSTAELLRRYDDVEQARNKQHVSLRQFLLQDVDPKEATGPLALYCFMTGYMCGISLHFFFDHWPTCRSDVISFSAIFVWCGFQTGNFAQVCPTFIFYLKSPSLLIHSSLSLSLVSLKVLQISATQRSTKLTNKPSALCSLSNLVLSSVV